MIQTFKQKPTVVQAEQVVEHEVPEMVRNLSLPYSMERDSRGEWRLKVDGINYRPGWFMVFEGSGTIRAMTGTEFEDRYDVIEGDVPK